MDTLIDYVVEKTGMDRETVAKVAPFVLEFVKGKLPEGIAGQLDGLLSQEGSGSGIADALGGALGGMFGSSD